MKDFIPRLSTGFNLMVLNEKATWQKDRRAYIFMITTLLVCLVVVGVLLEGLLVDQRVSRWRGAVQPNRRPSP